LTPSPSGAALPTRAKLKTPAFFFCPGDRACGLHVARKLADAHFRAVNGPVAQRLLVTQRFDWLLRVNWGLRLRMNLGQASDQARQQQHTALA
jgi:hypothetical protein